MAGRLVSLVILVASGVYLATALQLPMGTMERPGAGFYPVAVGVFAIATAAVWTVLGFRRTAPVNAPEALEAGAHGRVLTTTLALVGFSGLLPWAGYPITAFLFVVAVLRSLGAGWVIALVTAVAAAAVSYELFAVLLSVPLPRGAWFD